MSSPQVYADGGTVDGLEGPETTTQPPEPGVEEEAEELTYSTEKLLEGEYETRFEVIGDLHGGELEDYAAGLDARYEEGELDGIFGVGDYADNPFLTGTIDGDNVEESLNSYFDELESKVTEIGEIAATHGVKAYINSGNHEKADVVHKDVSQAYEEIVNPVYAERNEDFDPEEQHFFDHMLEGIENVENIEGQAVELGDKTIIGTGPHYSPEITDEDRPEDEDYEEKDWEPLLSCSNSICNWINSAYDWWRDTMPGYEKEKVLPEGEFEEFKEYEEEKLHYQELIDDAENGVFMLGHAIPQGDSEEHPDYMGEEAGNQGEVLVRELLEENDKVVGAVGGHFHSVSQYEMFDKPVFQVGGGYMETGWNDEGIVGTNYGDRDMFENSPAPEPQPSQQSQEELIIDSMKQAGGPDEFLETRKEAIRQNMVEEGFDEEMIDVQIERFREQMRELWEERVEGTQEPEEQESGQTGN